MGSTSGILAGERDTVLGARAGDTIPEAAPTAVGGTRHGLREGTVKRDEE